MSLKENIKEQVKDAMRARDQKRLTTLRTLSAAIKQKEVDERIELDDKQTLAVIQKLVKQRKESISQYKDAGRDDLVENEQSELEILETFLPEQMSEAEAGELLDTIIEETGASSMQDMGKVMALLKEKSEGRADMSILSKLVKSKLA